MIKFFHASDFHFGVENYGKVDSKTGIHSRLLDFQKNLSNCIDQAIDEKIDFFLFCGDAYKTAFPTPTQQKFLTEQLFRLQKAGIPVVSIVGNHDHPLSFGKNNSLDLLSYLPLNGFHVFSKPNVLKLKTKNGDIQVVGIPWPTRNNVVTSKKFHLKSAKEITEYLSQAVGDIIQDFASKLDPNIPAILAGHLTVSTGVFSGSEKCAVFGNDPTFLASQLALPQFDYVALGHLHRHQNLNSKGFPPVVYSGSIERIDFGERKEKKGFCRVLIDHDFKDERCKFEFVELQTRPMIQIEVQLKPDLDQTEQILQEIDKYNIDDAILKVVYHIPEGKADKVDLQEIHQACSKAINVVSIIPIRKVAVREKRANLDINMDLNTLLSKYLDSKEYSDEKKKQLIEKAKDLYSQAFEEQNNEEKDLDIKLINKKSKKGIQTSL